MTQMIDQNNVDESFYETFRYATMSSTNREIHKKKFVFDRSWFIQMILCAFNDLGRKRGPTYRPSFYLQLSSLANPLPFILP